jgi:hypothetical protein
VQVAALALAFATAVQTSLVIVLAQAGQAGWAQLTFAAVLSGLLLLGILRADRLAWVWGRMLGFTLAALLAAALAVELLGGQHIPPWEVALALGGLIAPLLVMALALSRPSAVAHFDLVCPECKATTRRGKDLFMKRALCTRCGTEW